MDSEAVEKQDLEIDGLCERMREGLGEPPSALGNQPFSLSGQKDRGHQRKGLLCGAGACSDKMISCVWGSCLFPKASLSLSHTLKITVAKDKVVSCARLAVFFAIYSHSEPGNTAMK